MSFGPDNVSTIKKDQQPNTSEKNHDVCAIEKPLSGQTETVILGNNTKYDIKFNADDVKTVSEKDGMLIFSFENDAKIIFQNTQNSPSVQQEQSLNPASMNYPGMLDVIKQLTAFLDIFEEKNMGDEEAKSSNIKYAAIQDHLAAQLADIEPSDHSEAVENADKQQSQEKTTSETAATPEELSEIQPAAGQPLPRVISNSGFGFQSEYEFTPIKPLHDVGPLAETSLKYDANFREPHPLYGDNNPASTSLSSPPPPPPIDVDLIVNNKASAAYINEDSQFSVPVSAHYTNGNGNEIMTLTVTGVNPAWTVTASGWTNKGNGEWSIILPVGQSQYNGSFMFKPPANSDVDMAGLKFTASVADPDTNAVKTHDENFDIFVNAVVDAPSLTVPASIQQAWYYYQKAYVTPLAISSQVGDTDGSEVITKIVINLGNKFTNPVAPFSSLDDMGIGLNKGTEVSPGIWEINVNNGDTAAALNGLALLVPTGMNYHAIHQSITGPHAANITVTSFVKEQFLSGHESTLTDNETTVVKNIALTFVITPLVLDLGGDGIDLVTIDAGVKFDMNNNGTLDNTSWVSPKDGMLALDLNHDGVINNQSELFGNTEEFRNGFENLAQYDTNKDGKIDVNDALYKDLVVWKDLNQDGISQSGELSSLRAFNVASINLNASETHELNGDSIITHKTTFTYNDGSEGQIVDAGFNVREGSTNHDGALLKGTQGKDIIYGTDDNDYIIGGSGNDILIGGKGADHFVENAVNQGVDVIKDFNVHEGDVLDFSTILQEYNPLQQAIDDFVFTRDVDGGTIVSVDVSGSGNAANAVDIVALEGVHNVNLQELLQNGNIHIA